MLIAAPFLLPRGAGARGAQRLWAKLRRRGEGSGERRAGRRALPPGPPSQCALPCAVCFLPAAHPRPLPSSLPVPNADADDQGSSSDFFIGLLVGPGSPAIGQTAGEAGLKGGKAAAEGLILVSIK